MEVPPPKTNKWIALRTKLRGLTVPSLRRKRDGEVKPATKSRPRWHRKLPRPQVRLRFGSGGGAKSHREPHERLARIGGSMIGSAALVIVALYAVAAV